MGQKKSYTLLDGVTGNATGDSIHIGQYQKAIIATVEAEGTPSFTIQLQYRTSRGTWVDFHNEAITSASKTVSAPDFPWHSVRAVVSGYASGTVYVTLDVI